ncbi:MAG: hypothetical protein RLP45_08115 [Haliea sp.]
MGFQPSLRTDRNYRTPDHFSGVVCPRSAGFKGIVDVIVPSQCPRSRALLAGVSDHTGVIACWLGSSVGISLISQQVAGSLIGNFHLSAATELNLEFKVNSDKKGVMKNGKRRNQRFFKRKGLVIWYL